jgi:hypothetical protein
MVTCVDGGLVMLSQSATSLTVTENSLAKLIGIAAPVDTAYASSALTVKVAALPSNGTILLADGVTPVGIGQSLTVTQLTALKFRPALNSFGNSSSFGFTVSDPAGASVSAAATLTIGAATVPVGYELGGVECPAEYRIDADRNSDADRCKLFLDISYRENHGIADERDGVPFERDNRCHGWTNAHCGAVDRPSVQVSRQ